MNAEHPMKVNRREIPMFLSSIARNSGFMIGMLFIPLNRAK